MTTDPYAPHLSHRREIGLFTTVDNVCEAEVLFFNLRDYRSGISLPSDEFFYSDAQYAQAIAKAKECGFLTVFLSDGVIVLQRD
jgi:hypothetical protein